MHPAIPSNAHPFSPTTPTPTPPPINPPSSLPLLPVFLLFFVLFCFISIFLFRDLLNYISASRGPAAASPPGRGKAGLDPAIIASFPTIPYAEVRRMIEGKCGGGECAVCLSEFTAGDIIRLLTVCLHAFHPGCIDSWLASHRTCPICRSNLELPQDQVSPVTAQEAVASGGGDGHVISMEEGEGASRATGQGSEWQRTR